MVASTNPIKPNTPTKENNPDNPKSVKTLKNPKTPNFTKNPLRKIENSVDASTWAFNNHDINGHKGILTPKPKTKQILPITLKKPKPVGFKNMAP
jgi:hypothetical protein